MQSYHRYVPPDQEGVVSANRLQKRLAPGTLRKDGSQTVRFEMPFAVWCHTCSPHALIGQGVRFNAEKTRVGKYYSTPIWCFRMRHPACGGTIEIRTDPQNTAYVVTEGGKARDYGDANDEVREGENGIPILTEQEREKRREDAFAQLEGQVEEKAATKDNAKRIKELQASRKRDWNDPWSVNKRLRSTFRAERKQRRGEEDATEALKTRLGTNIDILPENNEDLVRARLTNFQAPGTTGARAASSRAVFGSPRTTSSSGGRSQSARRSGKDDLRRQLVANTRAALNPFG